LSTTTADNQYRNTQQSYGFWAVPPDVGTKVLVMFVEGDRSRGYWFACVPDEGMNFMVPDPRASTEITSDETPSELQGAKLPVSEYNKQIEAEGKDPTLRKKPYNKDFTQTLITQGTLFDETRGTTTSSSRRELPSSVYGWSTPGPLDKRPGSPRGKQGLKDAEIDFPISRLGGSSIVMDDGDDKFVRTSHAADGPPFYINKEANEDGGDETIPQNECIRIRTRTGHQILLHNSEDLIYIANSRGTAWIELTSDGKIDIHAQDSISMMTNQDFNLTAMRDINMEAGRNVNIRAAARWSDEQPSRDGIRSGQVHIESFFDTNITTGEGGGTLSLNTSRNWELNVDGEIKLQASKDINIISSGSIYEKAERSIHHTSDNSYYRKSKSNSYDITDGIHYIQSIGPINMTSRDSIFQSAEVDVNITSAANMFVQAIGGTFDLKSEGSLKVETDSTFDLKSSGNFNIESDSPLGIKAGGTIGIDGGPNVEINSGAASGASGASGATPATVGISGNSATVPTESLRIDKLPRIILPYVFPGATEPVPYETIIPRAPQHEPWTHHENMNPEAFKPDQTDREQPGELPSNDRILTPDTFAKGTSRESSVVVPGSGGSGIGNEGSHDTARGSFNTTSVTYDGTQPIIQVGDFTFSPTANGPLATIKTKRRGLSVQVAEVFKENFQGFIDELEDSGYEIRNMGGYANRSTVSSRSPSYHASGAAIDINVPNPVINGSPNGYFRPRPANAPITDMPIATVRALCRKYGLGWGGDWRSADDAMHFSTARAEGGAYNLPRNGRIPIPDSENPLAQQAYAQSPNEGDEPENQEAVDDGGADNRTPSATTIFIDEVEKSGQAAPPPPAVEPPVSRGPASQRDFGTAPDSEVLKFLRENISGVENNGYSFISNGTQFYVTTNEEGGRFITDSLPEFYNQQLTLGPTDPSLKIRPGNFL
jgi:hypothetical protein